jgi:hypothetical protein
VLGINTLTENTARAVIKLEREKKKMQFFFSGFWRIYNALGISL